MNIVYVHNVGNIGGAERVTLDIIQGLAAEHSLYLVTPENGPLLRRAEEAGAQSAVLDVRQPDIRHPIQTWLSDRQWRMYLKDKEIELIHTGDLFIARSLIRVANQLNIPLVCHVHFPIDEPALKWIFRSPPKRVCFIYCSQELHDTTVPKVNRYVPSAEHYVVHNGVDTESYKKFEPKKGVFQKGRFNIGIIANLQERKGHKDFIEAAAIVAKRIPSARFHIVGGDVFGESRISILKELVRSLGVQEVLTFHGQVDNVKDYLNELNIYVCASHEEAFPISILEAMAFQLPIISTDVNGIPEALVDNESALLVTAKNKDQLAHAIIELVENREKSKELGLAAFRRVREKFGITNFVTKVDRIYLIIKRKKVVNLTEKADG